MEGGLVLRIQKDGRRLLFEEKMGVREREKRFRMEERIGWEKAPLKGFEKYVLMCVCCVSETLAPGSYTRQGACTCGIQTISLIYALLRPQE